MAKSRRDTIRELIVEHNQPCPSCGSSDARQVYSSGSSYCFSCRKYSPKDGALKSVKESNEEKFDDEIIEVKKDEVKVDARINAISEYPTRGFKDRKISKTTCEYFGVKVAYNSDGQINEHYYPYGKDSYKVRKLPKSFSSVGDISGKIFGMEQAIGGKKRCVLVEGEIDALSVAEAMFEHYKKYYPVVSLRSSTATKDVLLHRDWFRSFDEIVVWIDNDEAGLKAQEEILRIIGYDKCKIVTPLADCKDANEVLLKHGFESINRCIWDAARFKPGGIPTNDELWAALEKYNSITSVPYPKCLEGLNSKLKGMRFGEIVLFISGSGVGKSSMLREIMYEIVTTTNDAIGIVSLEESVSETTRKLSAMPLNKNPSKEEIPLEELRIGFDKMFGSNKIILLDHAGETGNTSILQYLEFMALSGAKYLFLDHITLAVAEGANGDDVNTATDNLMAGLLKLVKKYDVFLGLVSHLRKSANTQTSFEDGAMPSIDSVKGSGSIKQISFDIVAFTRNLTDEDPIKRNTIRMSVLKSRYSGLSGPVPGCTYDYDTGRLKSVIEDFEEL